MAHKVVFVPGRDFFTDGSGARYMRLNFSNATPDQIRAGVARLAAVCANAIQPVA
jgi:2-aminoadipate transaminase